MHWENRDVLLSDLIGKFELLLEDHATLHAEMRALRREMHERHELSTFLLKAIATDLAAHRADSEVHADGRPSATGRHACRPARLTSYHPPS